MSLAEYLSKPPPLFGKLADMLGNLRAVQFVVAKVSALLGGNKASTTAEPTIDTAAVARSIIDADPATLRPPITGAIVEAGTIAGPETNDRFARESLIRRRWAETGSKLWNADVHAGGNAALNIQGGVALLPPKPGGTLPRYDTLEFRTLRSCVDGHEVSRIVCEGVAVEPPQRRSRDGLRRAQ